MISQPKSMFSIYVAYVSSIPMHYTILVDSSSFSTELQLWFTQNCTNVQVNPFFNYTLTQDLLQRKIVKDCAEYP